MKHKFAFIQFIFISCVLSFYSYSHAEPANLGLLKLEVLKYHDSGLYEKELKQHIIRAEKYIIKEATFQKKHHPERKLALILDIDETSLSTYAKMIKLDFSSNRALIQRELMAGDSPAIEPMLALYRKAKKLGVAIFFITGRREALRQATEHNLTIIGYKDWTALYLKPQDYANSSNIPYKSSVRKQISKSGYLILATIGDQYSDLRGGYAQKGFKLPNPYYYLP